MRFILIAYDSTKQDKQNRKICGSASHGRKGRTRTATVYPKGLKLSHAGEKTLKKNPTLINDRPKKTLDYKIPAFLFEKERQVLLFIWHFFLSFFLSFFFREGGCDCRKGKGMLNKTQDVCALSHTFFLRFRCA